MENKRALEIIESNDRRVILENNCDEYEYVICGIQLIDGEFFAAIDCNPGISFIPMEKIREKP